tara:strand:+ start:87 stop:617 length:531 start_codon:yes stop_codon:yes gene_type:complete
MENQQSTSSKQVMLNYGLILGVVSILIAVVNYAFGDAYKPHWIISVIGISVTIAVIVFGLKNIKESNGGFLKLSEALKIGLGIALISALIYVAYLYVFSSFIEPDFYQNLIIVQEQKLIDDNPNFTDEQLEVSVAMMKKFVGPGVTTAFTIAGSLFFGFIISLIAGLIMKKTQEED